MTDATVPFEAFDDTHPDHEWWVQRTGRCLAGASCRAHGTEPPGDTPRARDERGVGGMGIIGSLAVAILVGAVLQVAGLDPLTYFGAAVDWTATLLTEAWSQIR